MKVKHNEHLFPLIVEDIKRINANDSKSLDLRIIKFQEEFGEFCAEYLKYRGFKKGKYDKDHLTEEMADALQCMISIYNDIEKEAGIRLMRDVLPKIFEKNAKWESQQKDEKERTKV